MKKQKSINGSIESLIYNIQYLKELNNARSKRYFDFNTTITKLNQLLNNGHVNSFLEEYNRYFSYNGNQMLFNGKNNNDKMIKDMIENLDTSSIKTLFNEYNKLQKMYQEKLLEINNLKEQLKNKAIHEKKNVDIDTFNAPKEENENLKLEIQKLNIKKPTADFIMQTENKETENKWQQTDKIDYQITKENNIDIKNQQKNKDYKIIKNNNISFFSKRKKTICLDAICQTENNKKKKRKKVKKEYKNGCIQTEPDKIKEEYKGEYIQTEPDKIENSYSYWEKFLKRGYIDNPTEQQIKDLKDMFKKDKKI